MEDKENRISIFPINYREEPNELNEKFLFVLEEAFKSTSLLREYCRQISLRVDLISDSYLSSQKCLYDWSINHTKGWENLSSKVSLYVRSVSENFKVHNSFSKHKVESSFFENLLKGIYKPDFNIDIYLSETDSNLDVQDQYKENSQNLYIYDNNNQYFGRAFSKFRKTFRQNQINLDCLKFLQNVLESRNTNSIADNDWSNSYLTYEHNRRERWISKIILFLSNLLGKSVKLRPSLSWELIWAIVPIIWLSSFLNNCNLKIRAV